MNDPFRPQESDVKSPKGKGFLAIIYWLINLIRLTEQEQDDAGIYFDTRQVMKSYEEKDNPDD